MRDDYLDTYNETLRSKLMAMSDDEIWEFLLENEPIIKDRIDNLRNHTQKYNSIRYYPLLAYPHGLEHFRKHVFSNLEEDRDGSVYTLILDFCFAYEKVRLGYYARGGFYDNPASCMVKPADDVMPPCDGDTELVYEKENFQVLEAHHLEAIINAMEKDFDVMTDNTREDIEKIKEMHRKLVNDKDWKAAYIFSD